MSPHGTLVRNKSGLPTLTLYSQSSRNDGTENSVIFQAVLK